MTNLPVPFGFDAGDEWRDDIRLELLSYTKPDTAGRPAVYGDVLSGLVFQGGILRIKIWVSDRLYQDKPTIQRLITSLDVWIATQYRGFVLAVSTAFGTVWENLINETPPMHTATRAYFIRVPLPEPKELDERGTTHE